MTTSRRTLASLAFLAALAGVSAAAQADRTALVVGGEPSKTATVVDAIAPWLRDHGHEVVVDAVADDKVDALVDCFLANDDACATPIVAAAKVDRLVFVMVEVEHGGGDADNVTLTGWLFDGAGASQAAERRFCEACRTQPLSDAAVGVAGTLLGVTVDATVALRARTTPAGAEVEVDGDVVGVTPLEVQATPGPHTVTFTLAGHRAVTRKVTAVAGTPLVLDETLVGGGGGGGGRLVPWLVVGAGVAAIASAAVLYSMNTDKVIDGDQQEKYKDNTLPAVALGVVGAAAVGVGTYLLLHHAPSSDGGPTVAVTGDSLSFGWTTRY